MTDTLTLGTTSIAKDLRLPPQARTILGHLESGKTISRLESMFVYQVANVADCILKIRRAGYNVVTQERVDAQGHRYARYSLPRRKKAQVY